MHTDLSHVGIDRVLARSGLHLLRLRSALRRPRSPLRRASLDQNRASSLCAPGTPWRVSGQGMLPRKRKADAVAPLPSGGLDRLGFKAKPTGSAGDRPVKPQCILFSCLATDAVALSQVAGLLFFERWRLVSALAPSEG